MKKVKVILDFLRLSATKLIEFARNTVTKMTGYASFTAPDVTLANVTAAATLLETKYNAAQGGGKQQTADMHQAMKALTDLLHRQAQYVDRIAAGNETMILSSGFSASKQPVPAKHPEFTVMNGEKEGEIVLKHKAVKHAKSWVWQYCADPISAGCWTLAGVSTKASFVIKGLNPGGKFWFRAAHVSINGQSAWCDPCAKIVL